MHMPLAPLLRIEQATACGMATNFPCVKEDGVRQNAHQKENHRQLRTASGKVRLQKRHVAAKIRQKNILSKQV